MSDQPKPTGEQYRHEYADHLPATDISDRQPKPTGKWTAERLSRYGIDPANIVGKELLAAINAELAAELEKRAKSVAIMDEGLRNVRNAQEKRHKLEMLKLREQLAAAVEALKAVKKQVCGDKLPNWKDDWATTNTRLWIADQCDAALAKIGEK